MFGLKAKKNNYFKDISRITFVPTYINRYFSLGRESWSEISWQSNSRWLPISVTWNYNWFIQRIIIAHTCTCTFVRRYTYVHVVLFMHIRPRVHITRICLLSTKKYSTWDVYHAQISKKPDVSIQMQEIKINTWKGRRCERERGRVGQWALGASIYFFSNLHGRLTSNVRVCRLDMLVFRTNCYKFLYNNPSC